MSEETIREEKVCDCCGETKTVRLVVKTICDYCGKQHIYSRNSGRKYENECDFLSFYIQPHEVTDDRNAIDFHACCWQHVFEILKRYKNEKFWYVNMPDPTDENIKEFLECVK